MFKRIFLSVFVLFGAALAPMPAAHAQGAQTLDRILPEIRRSYPGTFSDAEPVAGPDGQIVRYRIKWITPDGRILFIEADARTGRVIGQSSGGSQPNPPRDRRNNLRNDDSENGLDARRRAEGLITGQVRVGRLLGN